MEAKYYQKASTYYDKDANDFDERYWKNPVLQQMRQSFREEVKRFPGMHMLEIGCGTGVDLIHFGKTHPDRKICGLDISKEMIRLSHKKIRKNKINNIEVYKGSAEDIDNLFPQTLFDTIYVFFGALNTVKDLDLMANKLKKVLKPGGILVLTFVNKWYLAGMIIESIRFHFSQAFARIKPVWGGYSPFKYVPSKCYSPKEIKKAFCKFTLLKSRGYCIVHPAWYYIHINRRLGKMRNILWKTDQYLGKSFLWKFGEYTLFVFQG